uniref:TFIIS N-terminal domain-containing protein n=1 Tax=Ornithorhynchus anatinus TaxID=9258 RepID=A0A6I8NNR7_ORNAN
MTSDSQARALSIEPRCVYVCVCVSLCTSVCVCVCVCVCKRGDKTSGSGGSPAPFASRCNAHGGRDGRTDPPVPAPPPAGRQTDSAPRTPAPDPPRTPESAEPPAMGRQEELLRIAKKLEKMVSGDSAEGALELLKELSSCTMTIQLLQTTRIGVAVNAVRKRCPDQQVVALAKVLIKNWKRLLDSSGTPHRDKEASGEKEKKAKGHAAPSGHRPGAAATAPAGDDRGRSGVTPRHRRESAGSTSPSTPPCSAPSSRRPPGDRDNGGKAKVEIPQSPSPPTSPTSPMPSPSLGSAGCLLAPCYLTGDSVRDKCVEMLAAVLKVDGERPQARAGKGWAGGHWLGGEKGWVVGGTGPVLSAPHPWSKMLMVGSVVQVTTRSSGSTVSSWHQRLKTISFGRALSCSPSLLFLCVLCVCF